MAAPEPSDRCNISRLVKQNPFFFFHPNLGGVETKVTGLKKQLFINKFSCHWLTKLGARFLEFIEAYYIQYLITVT